MFIDIDVDECMISMFIDIVKMDIAKNFGAHEHELILRRVGLRDGDGMGITEIDSVGIDGGAMDCPRQPPSESAMHKEYVMRPATRTC